MAPHLVSGWWSSACASHAHRPGQPSPHGVGDSGDHGPRHVSCEHDGLAPIPHGPDTLDSEDSHVGLIQFKVGTGGEAVEYETKHGRETACSS